MANNSILQVFIVFLIAQVCLLMMIEAPVARAAGRLMRLNPVCCPKEIFCCAFGGMMSNGTASSTNP
uniref:Hydrophobic seed protein domain-containing protein n=1 Tax=Aegilops tauschii subsp. strangulata TaxID=200361 RepID=A0A453A1J6_AEGTS